MRTICLLLAFFLVACNDSLSGRDKRDQELLTKLNTSYDSALLRSDTARIGRLYANDFEYITPEGQIRNRKEQLDQIKNGGLLLQHAQSDEVKIRLYGDMAVLTGVFTGRGVYRGNPIDSRERYSSVWIRKDTSWQMVMEQGTRIAQ